MIANALLFTIVILLGYGFWLLDQLKFMARYKAVLFHAYGDTDSHLPRRALRESVWRCARHRPPLLPEEYRAQTLAPRQAIQRRPCGHARSRQRGGVELMSRDAFSYDPQDTPRDSAAPLRTRGAHRHPRIRGDARRSRRRDAATGREAPRLASSAYRTSERSDSPRAYYVRDRAYLLRDSEMHSLKEIGKFRVIAVPDLAKYAYGGDRERMEKDIRAPRTAVFAHRQDHRNLAEEDRCECVTLTKAGHRLLTKHEPTPRRPAHLPRTW